MRFLAVSLCALAALAFAFDKVKIEPKYTKGDSQSYKVKITMDVGGTEAHVGYRWESKVLESSEKGVQFENNVRELDVKVGDEVMEVPFGPLNTTVSTTGVLQKAEGGVAGTDAYRMALLSHFFAPKAEVEKDGTWKEEIAKVEGSDLQKLTVEGTYLGVDTEVGSEAHKFKTKVTEDQTGLVIESTYWVTIEGKLIKQDGSFVKLPIPIAGTDADGKIKVEKA